MAGHIVFSAEGASWELEVVRLVLGTFIEGLISQSKDNNRVCSQVSSITIQSYEFLPWTSWIDCVQIK